MWAVLCLALVLGAASQAAARPTHHHPKKPKRPNLITDVYNYLQDREGSVSVAVYDAIGHRTWLDYPSDREQTASIVKVDILETLLHQKGSLDSSDQALAARMIEYSDNDAATALWDEIGQGPGLAAYNQFAGLTDTTPGPDGYWGLTTTSAHDQVVLLHHLAFHTRFLTDSQRKYELYLMRHVTPSQNWGVTAGLPSQGVSVAVKNGWLPYGQWIVNSDGIVEGLGHKYLISVLTRSPTESYGIDTIEGVSGIVWRDVRHLNCRKFKHC